MGVVASAVAGSVVPQIARDNAEKERLRWLELRAEREAQEQAAVKSYTTIITPGFPRVHINLHDDSRVAYKNLELLTSADYCRPPDDGHRTTARLADGSSVDGTASKMAASQPAEPRCISPDKAVLPNFEGKTKMVDEDQKAELDKLERQAAENNRNRTEELESFTNRNKTFINVQSFFGEANGVSKDLRSELCDGLKKKSELQQGGGCKQQVYSKYKKSVDKTSPQAVTRKKSTELSEESLPILDLLPKMIKPAYANQNVVRSRLEAAWFRNGLTNSSTIKKIYLEDFSRHSPIRREQYLPETRYLPSVIKLKQTSPQRLVKRYN